MRSDGTRSGLVTRLTACYADVEFPDGMKLGEALEQGTAGETPFPSSVVDSVRR